MLNSLELQSYDIINRTAIRVKELEIVCQTAQLTTVQNCVTQGRMFAWYRERWQ